MGKEIEVVVAQPLKGLGPVGGVKKVKRGYGKYLLRSGYALLNSKEALNRTESLKKQADKKAAKEKESAVAIAAIISGKQLSVEKQVHDEGKLYGSVTPQEVQSLIHQAFHVDVDRKKLIMPDHIKETGEHTIGVQLHSDVHCELTLIITDVSH